MQWIQDWLNIIYIVLGILITGLSFLIPLIKSEKAKKVAQRALAIATAVQPYIVEAEKFINYTGAEKKEYVMTKANQYAIEHNIPFNAEAVDAQVENLVALTKQVNKRDKDMAKSENIEVVNAMPTENENFEIGVENIENVSNENQIAITPNDIIVENDEEKTETETETEPVVESNVQ